MTGQILEVSGGQRVRAAQPVERFPDDVELAFHRRAEHDVGLVLRPGLVGNEVEDQLRGNVGRPRAGLLRQAAYSSSERRRTEAAK